MLGKINISVPTVHKSWPRIMYLCAQIKQPWPRIIRLCARLAIYQCAQTNNRANGWITERTVTHCGHEYKKKTVSTDKQLCARKNPVPTDKQLCARINNCAHDKATVGTEKQYFTVRTVLYCAHGYFFMRMDIFTVRMDILTVHTVFCLSVRTVKTTVRTNKLSVLTVIFPCARSDFFHLHGT